MENDPVEDRSLARVILRYLDIPYFWNNPWYVDLWKRYYLLKKEIEIVFLMHTKEIGSLHAWLYLQLHAHFKRKGCNTCAQLVIEEGLKRRAHPINELEEKLIPEEKMHLHALEKPRHIRVFGREWLRSSRRAIPASVLVVGGEELSLLEYKILQYMRDKIVKIEEETEKGLNEVSILFGSLSEKKSVINTSTSTNLNMNLNTSTSTNINKTVEDNRNDLGNNDSVGGSIKRVETENADSATNTKKIKKIKTEEDNANVGDSIVIGAVDLTEEYKINSEQEKSICIGKDGQIDDVFGCPSVGDKVVMNGILYIVKKMLGPRTILSTKIASLASGNITLNARDCVLRAVAPNEEKREIEFAKILKDNHLCVPIEDIVVYTDKKILLLPFMEMGSLKRAVELIQKSEGNLPDVLCAHYIKEILVIGQALSMQGISISHCISDNFVLVIEQGRITLRLASYSLLSIQEAKNAWSTTEVYNIPAISFLLSCCKQKDLNSILSPQPPPRWIDKIDAYLSRQKESMQLTSLFIAQEVAIYEEE